VNRKGKLSTRQIQILKREKAHRDRVAMHKLNRERVVAKAKRALRDSLSDHDSDMVNSTLSDTTSESDSSDNEKTPEPKKLGKKRVIEIIDDDDLKSDVTSKSSDQSTSTSLTAKFAKLGEVKDVEGKNSTEN